MTTKLGKLIILSLTVTILLVLAKQLGVLNFLNELLQSTLVWLDSLGIWAPVAFAVIYTLAAVLWISGAALTLGAGALFGVIKGSIYVSIASTIAATVAFLAGRYLARGWVAQQIEKNPKFKAVDTAVAREGWKIVGLTRLSPLFPFVFLNYAFGVTKIPIRDYVLASWIGMIPGTILYVYLGSLAKDLTTIGSTNQANSQLQWLLRIVGFLATVLVTLYTTKIARQALDEEIASQAKQD